MTGDDKVSPRHIVRRPETPGMGHVEARGEGVYVDGGL